MGELFFTWVLLVYLYVDVLAKLLVKSDNSRDAGYAGTYTNNAKSSPRVVNRPLQRRSVEVRIVQLAWIHHGSGGEFDARE